MARFFDLDAANAALPELRTILETLRDERSQLIELRDEFARQAALETATPGRAPVEEPADEPDDVSPGVKVLALTSIVLWFGAITAGRLMAYIH